MNNYKRIILCGPAAAGKDWSRQILQNLGYTYAPSFTSRPIRIGEVEGKDYFYRSKEEIEDMIHRDLFYEYIKFGDYYYGTTKTQIDVCNLFIMTPGGISMLKEKDRKESYIVYLNPSEDTRRKRLNDRVDFSKNQKRIELDKIEFEKFYDFDISLSDANMMREQLEKIHLKIKQRKILYVDMDGVIADFDGMIKTYCPELETSDQYSNYEERSDKVDEIMEANPRSFLKIKPIEHSIDLVKKLSEYYEVLFLSTPMWNIPESYMDKRLWLKLHFGDWANKRLVLTHRKDLNIGDYLIDDRLRNGAAEFTGKHIHLTSEEFPTWVEVYNFLISEWINQ